MTMIVILIVLGLGLLAYALMTQYSSTPSDQSTLKRVWLSVMAGAGVLGASIMQLIHSWTAP